MLIACAISFVPMADTTAQSQAPSHAPSPSPLPSHAGTEADSGLDGPTGIVGTRICEDRTVVLRQLSSRFREAPVAMGLATNGAVLEVLSSGEGTSWTIILTGADGISCVLATGESWQERDQVSLSSDTRS